MVSGHTRNHRGADRLPAKRIKAAIKRLRRMDVRRGPMHNDGSHGPGVARS
jgi:hypothetical protein